MINWNLALAEGLAWAIIMSPFILVGVWAWFSKNDRIRKLLKRALYLAAATPILYAMRIAILSKICLRGNFAMPFGACGAVSDATAAASYIIPTAFFIIPAVLITVFCLYLALQDYVKNRKR